MVFFLIPKSTPLSSLIEAYCARQRLDTRYTRFTQQGTEALSETKNMGELGAKAGKILSFNAQSLVVLSGGSNAPILFTLGAPVDGVEFHLPEGHVKRVPAGVKRASGRQVLSPDVGRNDEEKRGLALDLRSSPYINLILKVRKVVCRDAASACAHAHLLGVLHPVLH